MHGWLTDKGVESLELFLPTETSSSMLNNLRGRKDPLFTYQYRPPRVCTPSLAATCVDPPLA
jgi:hypothetical protein